MSARKRLGYDKRCDAIGWRIQWRATLRLGNTKSDQAKAARARAEQIRAQKATSESDVVLAQA
jgi:hypothetical protein